MVTTYNRKDELGKCLDSILRQDFPCEILVLDDASSDGTAEYVRENYPTVVLDRVEQNVGLIGQRSRGVAIATTDVVVSIDDDIELIADDTLSRVAEGFDSPDVAAVTFPSIDVRKGPFVESNPPTRDRRYASAEYRGGVVALRRDAFLAAGGYDRNMYRQGEEMDLAVRLYGMGFLIAMVDAVPVHHYESPRRAVSTIYYYRGRNLMLFAWRRIPLRLIPLYATVRALRSLRVGLRDGFLGATIRGLLAGHAIGIGTLHKRDAVSLPSFRVYEWLRRGGPRPIEEARQRMRSLRPKDRYAPREPAVR